MKPPALAAEGSDEEGDAENEVASADATANASLAMTIASLGEEIRPVEASGAPASIADDNTDVLVAAAEPAAGPETVLVKSGWTIQIGAFPSQEGAHSRLAEARESGIDLLSNKPGFTMAVQSGHAMLYRARFSGFTETHAREACKELTAKGLDCLPLSP